MGNDVATSSCRVRRRVIVVVVVVEVVEVWGGRSGDARSTQVTF